MIKQMVCLSPACHEIGNKKQDRGMNSFEQVDRTYHCLLSSNTLPDRGGLVPGAFSFLYHKEDMLLQQHACCIMS